MFDQISKSTVWQLVDPNH